MSDVLSPNFSANDQLPTHRDQTGPMPAGYAPIGSVNVRTFADRQATKTLEGDLRPGRP